MQKNGWNKMTCRKKKSGQVLFLGLIMLLVLFFAIFLFFDIHNVIRGKIKLETAEQSAALTAAAWQAKSLNLIGELNLLIAAESVWSNTAIDIPEHIKDEAKIEKEEAAKKGIILNYTLKEQKARVLALNEMQSRITFIGPLIALASAQQAAIHNGINTITESSKTDKDTHKKDTLNLADDFREYFNRLDDQNNIYYTSGNVKIQGYKWLEPYKALLKEITSTNGTEINRVAVRPNAMIMGLEGIRPAYLADTSLYSAIHACNKNWPAWCHRWLRYLIKQDDSFFEGSQWYSPDFSMIQFSQQSEIYPLEVMLSGITELENPDTEDESNYTPLNYEEFRNEGDIQLKRRFSSVNFNVAEIDKIIVNDPEDKKPIVNLYAYNNRWFPGRYYTGPITPDVGDDKSPWQSAGYYGVLRKDVAAWAHYGGAAAYAECVQNVPDTLPFKSKISKSKALSIAKGEDRMELGTNVGVNGKNVMRNNLISKNTNKTPARVGGNYTLDNLQTGCVAKPLGKLSNDKAPTTIPIVLPVFYRASLIPGTMQAVHVFSYDWPLVEEFILGLRTMLDQGKDIFDSEDELFKQYDMTGNESGYIPIGASHMLEALRILSSKEFRRKGWNPDYKEEDASLATLRRYFEKENYLYDPVSNPRGPGWLQQPVVHNISYIGGRFPDEVKEDSIYMYSKKEAEALNKKVNPKKEQFYYVPPDGEVWACYKGEYIKIRNGKLSDVMEYDSEKGCGPRRGGIGGGHPGSAIGPSHL